MSVAALTWAFAQELKPVDKLALVALADWADEDGYCFPGIDRLAERVQVSRRTMIIVLNRLVESGFITRESRYATDGKRTSNGYWLALPGLRADSAPSADYVQNPAHYVQTAAHRKDIRNEPSVIEPPGVIARTREAESDDAKKPIPEAESWLTFWSEYPRKAGKPAAAKAWAAAIRKGATGEEILTGLRRHLPSLASRDVQYIPHPATFLNQERWNDPVELRSNLSPPLRMTTTEKLRLMASYEDPTLMREGDLGELTQL